MCIAGANGAILKCVPTPTTCSAGQLPLISADGTVGCQNGGICPEAYPVTVRSDLAGTIKQCQAVGLACPVGFATPLYGTFTFVGAPTGLTITNCWADGVITTTCNVNVAAGSIPAGGDGSYTIPYKSAAGAATVVGCVKLGSTACPPNTGLTYLSMAGASTAATLEQCYQTAATSCEPAVAGAFSAPAFTKSALTACIKGLIATCPFGTGAGNSFAYPITATTVGNPLTVAPTGTQIVGCYSSDSTCFANAGILSFTLISNPPSKTYCVPPIIGVSTCAQYGGATTGDPAVNSSSFTLTANGGQWVGCTQGGAALCPVPYVQLVPGGIGTTCTLGTANTCDPATQFQVWEVVAGVPTPTSCVSKSPDGCVAKFGAGNFALMKTGAAANGGDQIGCLGLVSSGANQACPAGYFSVYTAPVSGKAPILSQCWPNSGATTACSGFGSSTVKMGSTVTSTLAGCTVASPTSCPSTYPYFYATTGGLLPNPNGGENSCVSSIISTCDSRVPIIDSTTGGALSPIIGCVGTAIQLAANVPCPATLPTPSTITSTYTFWTAQAQNSGSFVAGGISACYRNDAANACGAGQRLARAYNSSAVVGCFQNPAALCPAFSVAGATYSTALLATNGATVVGCSTAPPVFDCTGVAGGYVIPVTDANLAGTVNATTLIACILGPAAACPTSAYPLISSTGVLTACRTMRSACAAGAAPLCEGLSVVASSGACNATYTYGCIAAGATSVAVCSTWAHPFFAVSLTAAIPGAFSSLVACYSGATGCSPGSLFPNTAVTGAGNTFNGCTDQSQQGCQTWWMSLGGSTCIAV